MPFPYHEVPDGAVIAPHHYIYGLLLVAMMLAVVWDNYDDREPLIAAFGVVTGLFGFIFTWPWYPKGGAIMSVAAPVIIILAVSLGWLGLSVGDTWDDYPVRWRIGTLLGSLIALDDVLEHAFGWPMPLDSTWSTYLYDKVPLLVVGLLAVIIFVLVVYSVYSDPNSKA